MILILVYTLSKTILGHSFFNYILVVYEQSFSIITARLARLWFLVSLFISFYKVSISVAVNRQVNKPHCLIDIITSA